MEVMKDRSGRLAPQGDSARWMTRQKNRREELYDGFRGTKGSNSQVSNGAMGADLFSDATKESLTTQSLFQYYRLARIFLSHGTFASKFHEFVFKMYADGLSYRQMIPHIRKKYSKRPRSVYTISKIMERNKKDMLTFHLTHPEGEYLHATSVPELLDPTYSPHLKTKRGKSKYS